MFIYTTPKAILPIGGYRASPRHRFKFYFFTTVHAGFKVARENEESTDFVFFFKRVVESDVVH